jgi:hypothetical protein
MKSVLSLMGNLVESLRNCNRFLRSFGMTRRFCSLLMFLQSDFGVCWFIERH